MSREPTDDEIDAAMILMRWQMAFTPNGSVADRRNRGAVTAAAGALISAEDPLEAISRHYEEGPAEE